jgi:hypothetical protein
MNSNNLCASFTLTAAEARRATFVLFKRSGGFFFGALNAATLSLGLYVGFERGWHAWFSFLLPFGYAILLARQAFRFWPIRSGIATDICLAEDGVHRERPALQTLGWKAFADTHDSGDLLLLFVYNRTWRLVGERIVIPKRAFPDAGVAASRLLADAPLRNAPR